jgi:hypothetical protein
MQSTESKHPTSPQWWLITLLGFSFVVIGIILQEKYPIHFLNFLGLILFGLGMSVIGAVFVKFCIGDLDRYLYERWRKKYIEVFTEKRQEEAEKYTEENENIKDLLLLLSVSASKAIMELNYKNSSLFKKLTQGAEMKIIILDPSSDSAAERAKADNPDNPADGIQEMKDKFLNIETILNQLNNNHKLSGELEIRVTKRPVNTTIYCHQDRLVFGPYFPDSRGDSYGSYSICRKYNERLYSEYDRLFNVQWGGSKAILVLNGGSYKVTSEYKRIKSLL